MVEQCGKKAVKDQERSEAVMKELREHQETLDAWSKVVWWYGTVGNCGRVCPKLCVIGGTTKLYAAWNFRPWWMKHQEIRAHRLP